MDTSDLSLEKFGSIGGDYFEILIAIALEELGYIEGETYIPSWHKKCVPGTWIEADFIITDKKAKHKDPINHPKFVFAIGHATSPNSAQMKFHRDVEQLLEVKALPNGDDILVVDILFCCPRETMGGWSKELISINEAIFDDHLIVWRYNWGLGLLKCLQDDSEKLSEGKNESVKKKNIRILLKKRKSFRRYFNQMKTHVKEILANRKSKSRIQDMFFFERTALTERFELPLLIISKERTDYKRGLIEVLALNDWELELLYRNHHEWLNGGSKPLEQLAIESGMSQEKFDEWWDRLKLLSVKIGTCEKKLNEYEDDILSEDTEKFRFFTASNELAFVFEKIEVSRLRNIIAGSGEIAPHLAPYIEDLNDLKRCAIVLRHLNDIQNWRDFFSSCKQCFLTDNWIGENFKRWIIVEVAKSAIKSFRKNYSYKDIANASGNPKLIKNSQFTTLLPSKQGNANSDVFKDFCYTIWNDFKSLPPGWTKTNKNEVLVQFVADRFDGMVKQRQKGALDLLIESDLKSFCKGIKANLLKSQMRSGINSVFTKYSGTSSAGVNVEIPYVLRLPDKRRIFVHRVMADGGVGHKRKEFASKIRTIRYKQSAKGIVPKEDYFSSILILDGNWITPKLEDPYMPIRMLTVAGWDYVVYPDGLSVAFSKIQKRIDAEKETEAIVIPEEVPMLLAAEPEEPIPITKKKETKKTRKRKVS